MRTVLNQLLGLLLLVGPVAAVRWHPTRRARAARHRPRPGRPGRGGTRWRVEIHSSDPGLGPGSFDGVDAPFPVLATDPGPDSGPSDDLPADLAWTRPSVTLEVEVDDPFSDDALLGLLGHDHRVRFETADEVVVDRGGKRLRVRATRIP